MVRILLLALLNAIAVTSLAQVPATNDACTDAIPLTVSTSGACNNNDLGVTYFATQSLPPCTGTMANDVWFTFVAASATQVIQLTNLSLTNPVFEVFSGTCGSLTSIACFTGSPLNTVNPVKDRRPVTGLIPGVTYYLRVYPNSASYGEFRLCIFTPSANDECAGAIDIPLNTGLNWTVYAHGNNRDNSQSPGGACTPYTNQADGWFKFVAQDSIHLINMTTKNGPVYLNNNTKAVVYSGSCGSLTPAYKITAYGQASNCFYHAYYDGYHFIRNLIPGNTYYVNVQQKFAFPLDPADSFYIGIGNVPANDDINGAIDIPVNAGTETISETNGTLINASPTLGLDNSCIPGPNSDNLDVWYKFTATSNHHLVYSHILTGEPITRYIAYRNNGGVLESIGCDVGTNLPHKFIDLPSLTPGTVYYIRIKTGDTYFPVESFNISITTPTPTPPNDDCSAPQTIPFNDQILATDQGSLITAGNNSRCVGTSFMLPRDMWYTFTPAFNANAVLHLITPDDNSIGLELYTGVCGAQTRINCANGNGLTTEIYMPFTANAGTTYTLRMYTDEASLSYSPFLLSFSTFAPLPVTITSFKATQTQQGTVKLIWKTEEESRINYYDVERSSNGISFNSITRVTARNNSAPSEYTAEDVSPVNGVSYYRLKIVDHDGKIEYSKTVTINIQDGYTGNLRVGRQGNFIMITNESAAIQKVNVNIFTANGQRIYSASKRLSAGANAIAVPGNVKQPLLIQLEMENKERRTFKIF